VRLVASDGQQVGITPLPEALQMARDLDLDLVEVAPLANPPVCRIMDYGKYKYEEAQRARESRRKSSAVAIKEMKYRPKIGIGDFDTKTRKVSEFLAEGHKVKVTIMFRGREVFHPELGKKILDQVAERVVEVGKVEAAPRLDGRNMTMVLAPDKRAQAKRSTTHRDAAPASTPTAPQPTATASAPTPSAPQPTATAPSAPAPSVPPEPQEEQTAEPIVVADNEAAPTA
jgi:translation initiation factor IF-3